MSKSHECLPWKDGYYTDENYRLILYHIKGDVISRQFISGPLEQKVDPRYPKGTLSYGDFGEADQEVIQKSGLSQYNVEISIPFVGAAVILKATLSEDGADLTFIEADKKLRALKWISEKDLMELKSFGDPADALPTHYKVQHPGKKGKLIWISGAPGLGKSTSGVVLARVLRLGDNLLFVVLDMSKEDQLSRIKTRHGNSEKVASFLSKCYEFFEGAGEDEPRTIYVVITKDMTRDDVVEKILLLVDAYKL